MRTLRRRFMPGVWAAIALSAADASLLHAQNQSTSQTPAPPPWDVTQARGKARQISFTTDEGTWLSPDVSPDGRTIAFDMVGDIWMQGT